MSPIETLPKESYFVASNQNIAKCLTPSHPYT